MSGYSNSSYSIGGQEAQNEPARECEITREFVERVTPEGLQLAMMRRIGQGVTVFHVVDQIGSSDVS